MVKLAAEYVPSSKIVLTIYIYKSVKTPILNPNGFK